MLLRTTRRLGRAGQAGQLEEALESVGCFSPLLRKLCPRLRMRAGLILNQFGARSVPTASNLPSALARPVFGPEPARRPRRQISLLIDLRSS